MSRLPVRFKSRAFGPERTQIHRRLLNHQVAAGNETVYCFSGRIVTKPD